MVTIFGKNYYIDIDGITEQCRTDKSVNDPEGDNLEINIFKYEIIKMCLDRILNDYEDSDEEMGVFGSNSVNVSFKIAFNTLIKNGLLIEDDE
jgi:hypothetical protein